MPRVFDPAQDKLIITVEGGLIQNIDGGPADLAIEVWDFDANEDPDESNNVEENDQGQMFWLTTWRDRLDKPA